MKLVEETGAVAEVFNKQVGRKAVDENNLHEQLGAERVLYGRRDVLFADPREITHR